MNKIAIVILNWNGRQYLERFLPSVVMYSTYPHVEIVVIDNASTDTSLEFLSTTYPTITRVVLDKNYGFTGGIIRVFNILMPIMRFFSIQM